MPKRLVDELVKNRFGLLLGPGFSASRPEYLKDLAAHLCADHNLQAATPLQAGEQALERGVSEESLQRSVATWVQTSRPSLVLLRELAKLRFNAVVSLCPDSAFEELLEVAHRRNAAKRDVVVLDEPGIFPRARTLPVFKLLGSSSSDNYVISETSLTQRAARWNGHMLAFTDAVQTGPILCLGLAQVERSVLRMLLGAMFYGPKTTPAGLVVAEDDPILADGAFARMVPRECLWIVSGSEIDIARRLQPSTAGGQMSLTFTANKKPTKLDLSAFGDMLSLVPREPGLSATERDALLDHLFMPDYPNWDAQFHNLDFERSAAVEICDLLKHASPSPRTIHLHGRAASGKTTALKRVAVTASALGQHVLWVHHYVHDDIADRLKHLFGLLREHEVGRILLVIDHLASIRTSPEEIQRLASQVGLTLDLLVATRTSAQLHSDILGARTVIELQDELDNGEWGRLPGYFALLGTHASEEAARADLAGIPETTRDTLAILFWLLPGTQRRIRDAVRHEYFALGQLRSIRDGLKQLLGVTPDVLKRAYELVAVSSKIEVPVPVEVLVRALDISFSAWTDAVRGQDGPAWGLFYEDGDDHDDGVRYRTRNQVVTEIIVDAVNGGIVASEGEIGCLEQLLAACVGTSPVYETFCLDVLVPAKQLPDYKLEDGLRLYDAAEKALPYPHRTLAHHRGLWLRRKNAPYADIRREFQRALATPDAPLGGGETLPFIHNSHAAAIVNAISTGELDLREGTRSAMRELEQARSVTFVNPHAVHVNAKLSVQLIESQGEDATLDRAHLAVRALSDVERLLLLGTPLHGGVNRTLFERVRDDLLDSALRNFPEEEAERLFREHPSHSQAGLVCIVRNLARASSGTGGGNLRAAYAKWKQYAAMVGDSQLSPELAEVGATLYYRWQVRPRSRGRQAASALAIDWETLQSNALRALTGERHKDDPFLWYLLGLAAFHLGRYGEAQKAFEHNRLTSMHRGDARAWRDYWINNDGTIRRVQATNRQGAGGGVPRVQIAKGCGAVRVLEANGWPRGTAPVGCYVVFSFEGPAATTSDTRLLFS